MMIYFLTILPNFDAAISALILICSSTIVIGGVGVAAYTSTVLDGPQYDSSRAEISRTWWRVFRWLFGSMIACILLKPLIPTNTQMAIIVAGNYLHDSEISKLPEEAASYLRSYIQKARADLEKELAPAEVKK